MSRHFIGTRSSGRNAGLGGYGRYPLQLRLPSTTLSVCFLLLSIESNNRSALVALCKLLGRSLLSIAIVRQDIFFGAATDAGTCAPLHAAASHGGGRILRNAVAILAACRTSLVGRAAARRGRPWSILN